MGKLVSLSMASRELALRHRGRAPGYRRLLQATVNGEITATQRNGRWFMDVDQVERELGLTVEHAA